MSDKMKSLYKILIGIVTPALFLVCCHSSENARKHITAKQILGNPSYLAISYGGYRTNSQKVEPTINQLKEDFKILSAMGIKIIRTYKVHLPEATNILIAIDELSKEEANFEMYVMLGAWIDCKNAWTSLEPNHMEESDRNATEIKKAIELAKKYPEIIKIIAVGNEAMVKWATSYFVQPKVILKWVNYLQDIKKKGELPKDLWITSSDNFASWGGGGNEYHVPELNELIKSVDYISMHTYPMHDTHYNPVFWGVLPDELQLSKEQQINKTMQRAVEYSQNQYSSVKKYIDSIGVQKPIHIGETGWASFSNERYGNDGSKATDEYKSGLYYQMIREWTNQNRISCFYFEAFDEPWKDSGNPGGSENHFGLFTVDGKAKFPIWNLFDQNLFKTMTRDGNSIAKTYGGNIEKLMKEVEIPPQKQIEVVAQ